MYAATGPSLQHDFFVIAAAAVLICRYGSLLEVDETLKKLRAAAPKGGEAMLVEEVGPEEIAGVVSKWTGVRVVRCCLGLCTA